MFIDLDYNTVEHFLNQLNKDTKPLWGSMSSSEMIVHLEDTLKLSNGPTDLDIVTPKEKLPLYVGFLESDKEMPQNFKVDYLIQNEESNSIEMDRLIDSNLNELKKFLANNNESNYKAVHPIYGELDFNHWYMLHTKHYTHHFKQFGLMK